MSSDFVRTPLPDNHRTVLAVVEAAGRGIHLSAQDVWLQARERQPQIGFATVHRALLRLQAAGLVLKIDVPGAAMAYYEPAADAHAHFRCVACGGIVDVAFALPHETLALLAAANDVAIDATSVSFSGRCRACAG